MFLIRANTFCQQHLVEARLPLSLSLCILAVLVTRFLVGSAHILVLMRGPRAITSLLSRLIGCNPSLWRASASRSNAAKKKKQKSRSPPPPTSSLKCYRSTVGSLPPARLLLWLWRPVSTMAESEADTPSTPIEFESKYFEFDGVRLPPFCRGKMEEIAGFSLRSSDIWIVTYPKSGKQPVMSACEADALLGPRCSLHSQRLMAEAWLS